MTQPSVLILAAGEAKRFGGISKQLLLLKSETIIERIIRQVKDRRCAPYIVTNNREIIGVLGRHYFIYRPDSHEVICDTLLSARKMWTERTIVLLGDAIYSKDLMDKIFACDAPIKVFGDTWEIFALSFSADKHDQIADTLRIAKETWPGKLRTFYKLYCGFDPEEKETPGTALEPDIFHYVRDWSRDIDSLEDYRNMQLELVNSNVLDDK